MKLKPLQPTLKEKKRYVAFEIISKGNIAFTDAAKAVWNSALSFLGTHGASHMGIQVLKYNTSKQRGLVKVSHTMVDELKASFALITHINQQPVIVRSVGASGILAKADKKYIGG